MLSTTTTISSSLCSLLTHQRTRCGELKHCHVCVCVFLRVFTTETLFVAGGCFPVELQGSLCSASHGQQIDFLVEDFFSAPKMSCFCSLLFAQCFICWEENRHTGHKIERPPGFELQKAAVYGLRWIFWPLSLLLSLIFVLVCFALSRSLSYATLDTLTTHPLVSIWLGVVTGLECPLAWRDADVRDCWQVGLYARRKVLAPSGCLPGGCSFTSQHGSCFQPCSTVRKIHDLWLTLDYAFLCAMAGGHSTEPVVWESFSVPTPKLVTSVCIKCRELEWLLMWQYVVLTSGLF